MFAEWDVDQNSSISKYEYFSLMAVFHAENELIQMQAKDEEVEAATLPYPAIHLKSRALDSSLAP